MSKPKRCPKCAQPTAARSETVYEYEDRYVAHEVTPFRTLDSRTDRFVCESCGHVWDVRIDYQSVVPA